MAVIGTVHADSPAKLQYWDQMKAMMQAANGDSLGDDTNFQYRDTTRSRTGSYVQLCGATTATVAACDSSGGTRRAAGARA